MWPGDQEIPIQLLESAHDQPPSEPLVDHITSKRISKDSVKHTRKNENKLPSGKLT